MLKQWSDLGTYATYSQAYTKNASACQHSCSCGAHNWAGQRHLLEEVITSVVEKKATASGSVDPAGCNDTIARNIEGTNNSITATWSMEVVRALDLNLPKFCRFNSLDGSTNSSSIRDANDEALLDQSRCRYVNIFMLGTSFSRFFSISDKDSSPSSPLLVDNLGFLVTPGSPSWRWLRTSSSRWGKNLLFWSVKAFKANLKTAWGKLKNINNLNDYKWIMQNKTFIPLHFWQDLSRSSWWWLGAIYNHHKYLH